jgi:ABC-type bacteriocin/lantibiotic exporter with double-glycine peptidase domain
MTGRTAIIIAHRLSTVRGLDRILVFDKGRIAEDGTMRRCWRGTAAIIGGCSSGSSGVARREEEVIG